MAAGHDRKLQNIEVEPIEDDLGGVGEKCVVGLIPRPQAGVVRVIDVGLVSSLVPGVRGLLEVACCICVCVCGGRDCGACGPEFGKAGCESRAQSPGHAQQPELGVGGPVIVAAEFVDTFADALVLVEFAEHQVIDRVIAELARRHRGERAAAPLRQMDAQLIGRSPPA